MIKLKEYFKGDLIIEIDNYILIRSFQSKEWSSFVWGYGGQLDYLGGGTREEAEKALTDHRNFIEHHIDVMQPLLCD